MLFIPFGMALLGIAIDTWNTAYGGTADYK